MRHGENAPWARESTMSDLAISVSVEGLGLAEWEAEFRSALDKAPGELGLRVGSTGGAGALGARRSGAVKVTSSAGDLLDTSVKVLGVVLSSLSLAVASAQLNLNMEAKNTPAAPPAPTFVCTIEGPQGVRQLVVTGAAIPSERVLRECLQATGTPRKVQAAPRR